MPEPLSAGDPVVVGPYRLKARLGAGGMGEVYLGESGSGRRVAVKLVRAEIARDPGFRRRFRREVELAMKAGGFWTAPVVDADPDAPTPWVASQYVPGPSLAEQVAAHGPLDEAALRQLAAGLAEALQAFHRIGLVHRDLKPSNVLLLDDGPRVIDFGISKALEDDSGTALTVTGTVLGTPAYMSPEQAVGREVGEPSDIFSLGSVLTFAATGRGPFGDGSTHALLFRVVHEQPVLSGLPPGVRPLIAACLSKEPAERPRAADLAGMAVGAVPVEAPGRVAAQGPVDGPGRTVHDPAPGDSAPGGPVPGGSVPSGPAPGGPAPGGSTSAATAGAATAGAATASASWPSDRARASTVGAQSAGESTGSQAGGAAIGRGALWRFRAAAYASGVLTLVTCLAMVTGAVHSGLSVVPVFSGLFVILYMYVAVRLSLRLQVPTGTKILVVLAAWLPLGTFLAAREMTRIARRAAVG
ncbi:protein kinase [Streptomyces sp. ISID311]|uniref:protein kinase domain-containing protein n=1 Tax=Streptomyces sp. ISID311 TaxID=2601673 RepID=UPI0011BD3B31|nr:protein kinase [Streptomyces sp. ISID311]TXC98892.1 protein kinase [Streptomyces sp. ISID311]